MVAVQDRRAFLRSLMAAGIVTSAMPSIARALDIPADHRTGTLRDVAHVVILTQENRSFDHYFGTMRGVRGFGDRFAIPAPPLPGAPNRTVFVQPDERAAIGSGFVVPFRLDTTADFRLYRPLGTPHGFTDSQAAWDNGRMGAWPLHKHNGSMAHFAREDLPFQFALAEAFTLCDAYHCAMHLCTNPNRLYLWTGTHDPLGRANGPAIDNGYDSMAADPYGHGGYSWTTYPERLMAAGIGFQTYQDMADNFSDNPLVGFRRYRQAARSSGDDGGLAQRTLATRPLDALRADVLANRLPEVSWVIAPEALSEHPSASTPLQGSDYTARVLDALTANPAVWARTVLLVNFDENDGLFDHIPPPAPPAREQGRSVGGTTVPADDEYHVHTRTPDDAAFVGRPYGLGMRVPLYVISPWSAGGFVASEVFDHTSVLRFLEERFGVREPNISAWRRAVCGDLTSCFDFSTVTTNSFVPALPPTAALSRRAAELREVAAPVPELISPPVQEAGWRPRRPTPYALDAAVRPVGSDHGVSLINRSAERAAVFHVYDVVQPRAGPARYTVGAGAVLVHPLGEQSGHADLFVTGPDGFHRRLRGETGIFSATIARDKHGVAIIQIVNLTGQPSTVEIADMAYGAAPETVVVLAHGQSHQHLDLARSYGWYDRQLTSGGQTWRLAGHLAGEAELRSDPAMGGAGPLRLPDLSRETIT